MSSDSARTPQTHTYTCALPTRGGVCDCQPGHNASIDPWPQLSGEESDDRARSSRPPASLFRPGGRHQMFETYSVPGLLVEQQ